MSGFAATPDDVRRAGELARMRIVATGLLALMAAVFVAACLGRARWPAAAPALAYVRAFAEAGMVGACADWFAVTALFRRPFGLPIPHTAIIPRNKVRIGAALGGFIAENFLTEAVLQERLRQIEIARWGGAWLSRPETARRLARRAAMVLPDVLASAPPGMLGDLVGSAALAAARATPAAPVAAAVLESLASEGQAQALVERLIEGLGGYIADHRGLIHEKVAAQSPSWLPKWVDRKLADKVSDGLIETVQEMRDPAHPWRQELRKDLESFIVRLRTDPELQARVEAMKQSLLAQPGLRAQSADLLGGLEGRIGAALAADRPELAVRLQTAIQAAGEWLANNTAAQAQLNVLGRNVAAQVIAPRRHDIGQFVANVVAGWDADKVADKLELQVGRDLQYIRINGTLVGGLVGLAIFAAARALGFD
jgi:uncharacterized membrane-anchored protein YjiN (DUF445 family)